MQKHSLIPISRLMPHQSQRNSYLGRQPHCLLPLPQFLLPTMTLYSMEYSFSQFGLAVQAVITHKLLYTPSLVTGNGQNDRRKNNTHTHAHQNMQALFSDSPNIGVLSTLFQSHIQSTAFLRNSLYGASSTTARHST